MHVYIIFTHPSRTSFSRAVLEAFTRGLAEGSHTYTVADLYQMGFQSEMDAEQYRREVGRDPDAPVPADVAREQALIDVADALTFIYPVWWSDCPAKLKGWFDRVLTYGYAYSYDVDQQRSSRINIEKALVLCSAGHTASHLEQTGVAEAMRRIMLHDRLIGVGVRQASLEILGGMMPGDDTFKEQNLERAYALGKAF
jgi:NAD(P)H dehydrogenase (quinone)